MTALGWRRSAGRWAVHLVLAPIAVLMVAPLWWMAITSIKPRQEVFSPIPQWLPRFFHWQNYVEALSRAPFLVYLWNSVVITAGTLAGQLVLITLAAYALARLRFRGREGLLYVFILQLMVPVQATFVPNYLTMRDLDLLDTRLAIILPFLASGYGTFLLCQTFKQIPQEFEDAARIDGCGHLRFLWHVLLPLARPTLIAFGLISFVFRWNDYFWPLIVTDSPAVRPLPIGLGMFVQQESGADWNLLMAATVFVSAPLLLLFVVFQRFFTQGFLGSGLKG